MQGSSRSAWAVWLGVCTLHPPVVAGRQAAGLLASSGPLGSRGHCTNGAVGFCVHYSRRRVPVLSPAAPGKVTEKGHRESQSPDSNGRDQTWGGPVRWTEE